MSRPQTRPSAPSRPTAGPPSRGGAVQRSGQTIEDIRALPDFVEDGPAVDVDPEMASSGRILEETVTITAAKFAKFEFPNRDDIAPETSLFLYFRRDGDDTADRPYEERYKYGSFALFAPSKDGNKVNVRPSVIKEGGTAPRPRKSAPGVLFLQSLQDAGGKNVIEKVKTDGAKALIGLRIHVRARKVEGQHENAKPVLLVDYIDTPDGGQVAQPAQAAQQAAAGSFKGRASAATATATVASTVQAVVNETDSLAEQALMDMLSAATDNKLTRAQLPTTLIRMDAWKTHAKRGEILAVLRKDDFINRQGAPWNVDGVNLSL